MEDPSPIRKLQQRVSELIVQLDLGKLEAIQCVEEQRAKLSALLDGLGQSANEATIQALRRQLSELQLQLQLGKMEARDAVVHQQRNLEEAMTAAGETLRVARHTAEEEFGDTAHALSDKLHLLVLNLGTGAILAREQAADAKEKLKAKLAGLSGSLEANLATGGEEARRLARESRHAFDEIRSNLRSLIG